MPFLTPPPRSKLQIGKSVGKLGGTELLRNPQRVVWSQCWPSPADKCCDRVPVLKRRLERQSAQGHMTVNARARFMWQARNIRVGYILALSCRPLSKPGPFYTPSPHSELGCKHW